MLKLTVLYSPPTDPAVFDTYYHGTHLPPTSQIPGLRRMELARRVSMGNGSPAAHHLIAELYFDNLAALQSGMSTPEGRATSKEHT